MNGYVWIAVRISLKFGPKGPIDNKSALVKIKVWCRLGDKPLPESMLSQGCQPWEIDFLTIYQKLPKFSLLNGIFSLLKHEMVTDYFKQFPYFAEN